MTNVLLRKLSFFADLSDSDRTAIEALCARPTRIERKRTLVREGEQLNHVHLLLEGWAYRYKHVPDGGRHILAYLVPGDLGDIHGFVFKTMDHTLGLLGPATVAIIPHEQMLETISRHPQVERALWWSTLVDCAVLREWLVNLGHRDAYKRIAHLFCELWIRMRSVGLADDDRFSLPLTQEEIGDTTGLTAVHVNRTLRRMRSEGLITLTRKQLTILEPKRLVAAAEFQPDYLHLDLRPGRAFSP